MARASKSKKIAPGAIRCPKCFSVETKKNGIVRNTQRFYCRICQRNFSAFTTRSYPQFLIHLLKFIKNSEVGRIQGHRFSEKIFNINERRELIGRIVGDDLPNLDEILEEGPNIQHAIKGIRGAYFRDTGLQEQIIVYIGDFTVALSRNA